MSKIEKKVNESIAAIRELTKTDCKVFIRLSSRSPKDAIYYLDQFPKLMQEKLEELENKEDISGKMHAFYMASTEGKTQTKKYFYLLVCLANLNVLIILTLYLSGLTVLAITSGAEAVDLLRKSDRIVSDLEHCLELGEPMNLIVRQFVKFPVKEIHLNIEIEYNIREWLNLEYINAFKTNV